jgi:gamma-glutamyltranspeptidase/glutathione hydrolase
MKRALLILLLLSCTFACRQSSSPYRHDKTLFSDKAMVVTAHPLASEIGLDIMKKGGNAVDAAIAVQLALAVVYPRAGNIGGGGFMVFRSALGEIETLDYREKAPVAAHRDMYLNDHGAVIPDLSISGHLASGVPGTVAGLSAAHERYGSLPVSTLLSPAIELAREGFKLTKSEADRLNRYTPDFERVNSGKALPFLKESPWKSGDLLVQEELAETFERMRIAGFKEFYEGQTAQLITDEMEKNGGLITAEDLSIYQSVWREPIVTQYDEYAIISMPPPSSGGIALTQLFELVEPYDLHELGFQSVDAVHLMVEAERRVYADRAQHLGDMDYYDVPIDMLLDPTYLAERMSDFSDARATTSDSVAAGDFVPAMESFQTTHISIVDSFGNAVSVTTTLNSNFGSKVYVRGAGFFLNNEMDDFSAKPGVPNQFGLVGAEANAIEPGKRMLSTMTPTIVTKNDDLFMIVGTPGGSTIITTVFQVIVNVIEFGMTMSEAVEAPRFHHQWLPDLIMKEPDALDSLTIRELRERGHRFDARESIGLVEAIMKLPDGRYEGAADTRSDDDAAAWK